MSQEAEIMLRNNKKAVIEKVINFWPKIWQILSLSALLRAAYDYTKFTEATFTS